MKFTLAFSVVSVLWATVFAQVSPGVTSQICKPHQFPHNYTGYKVERQILEPLFYFSYPPAASYRTIVVTCKDGVPVDEWIFPADFYLEDVFPWGKQTCSDKSCIQMARKQSLALRTLDLYLPFSPVGGLFELVEGDGSKDEHYRPLSALLSEVITDRWVEEVGCPEGLGLTVTHIPLLMSPDLSNSDSVEAGKKDDWFKNVSVTESYNFTYKDRSHFRLIKNYVRTYVKMAFHVKTNSRAQKLLAVANSVPSLKSEGNIDHGELKSKLSLIRALKPSFEGLINNREVDFGTLMALVQVAPKSAVLTFLEKVDSLYKAVKIEASVTNFGEKYHT